MPRLIIDSASRNPLLFPDADRYEVELPYEMKNVASLTLLKTDVTFADTLIGLGQDRIVVDGVDGVREIAIRHEDHTGSASLMASLQAALDSQYPTAMIGVGVVDGDRLRLASSAPFSASDTGPTLKDVMGRPLPASVVNTAARVLGLAAQVEARASWDGVAYAVTFPHPVSLVNERYLVLNISGVSGIDSPAPHVHGAVGLVDPGMQAIKEPFFVELNPRRTLHKMRITLTRPNGSRYDFRGSDHRLEMQIT